jgi:hypothetical protein
MDLYQHTPPPGPTGQDQGRGLVQRKGNEAEQFGEGVDEEVGAGREEP